jgi:hypothetical protein
MKPDTITRSLTGSRSRLIMAIGFLLMGATAFAGQPLPEFAFHQFTVAVQQADGRPAAGVAVYGWCPELNLIWPRRDKELEGRNDILWHESYLGHTGADGRVQVIAPRGKWGFFAAGRSAGGVLAAWSDFRERAPGETVRLAPQARKQWTLGATNEVLAPKRIFVRAELFPVWIPVNTDAATAALRVEMGRGRMHLWAEGDGSLQKRGFALGWGPVDEQTPDGKLDAPGPVARLTTHGGGGRAVLSWWRIGEFGVEGSLLASAPAEFLFTPGAFTISYRRPIGAGLIGDFTGHFYKLDSAAPLTLGFDGPLAAGLDQELEKADKKGQRTLAARLYLVDTNGHLLGDLATGAGHPFEFPASVSLAGQRYAAAHGRSKSDVPDQGEFGPTFFAARVGALASADGAVWEFDAPAGLLPETQMQQSEMVDATTESYTIKVPRVLVPHARNILEQAETLVQNMQTVSGRKRRRASTTVYVKPGQSGAYATHGGAALGIGSKLFFSDNIMTRHDMAHEIGHNLDFNHGGLHETVVEATRCFGDEQVSQQPAKWMFIDRMNGLKRKEILYPNTGLYLCCYGKGGQPFLRFMLKNDKTVTDKLTGAGFTTGEVTAALCELALGRDMTAVCAAYGLNVSAARVASASATARQWIKR